MNTLWKKRADSVYQPRIQLTFKAAKMAVTRSLVYASLEDAKIIYLKSGNLRSIDCNAELEIFPIHFCI